uniref:Uncharacterized protein n=1 Tax=Romanomermis culicivorax TaxID=13658 RepID=A0A915JQ30_ROMCU
MADFGEFRSILSLHGGESAVWHPEQVSPIMIPRCQDIFKKSVAMLRYEPTAFWMVAAELPVATLGPTALVLTSCRESRTARNWRRRGTILEVDHNGRLAGGTVDSRWGRRRPTTLGVIQRTKKYNSCFMEGFQIEK